jgi:hypothetical protein
MPQFEVVRSAIIERICQASPEKRRKLIEKLVGKERPKKETSQRLDFDRKGKWSQHLIVEVLKGVLSDHGKLTIPLLRKLRKEDPEKYPAPTTVCLRFGSWDEAKRAAGVNQIRESIMGGNEYEDEVGFFLSLYHQFGITTRDLYYEGRKKYPQIVPPYSRLREIFGSFTQFKRVAKLDSCSEQIDKLLILIQSMNGRWPNRKICKENGIDIRFLDKRLGSRQELKEFMRDLISAQKSKELDSEK